MMTSVDILNPASRILQYRSYYMRINSARHQHDVHRKNSKQSGIVAIDSCFALLGARQYGATTRESYDEKYPRTLILSPDPELPTPTESRHTTCLLGGDSPSVK